MSSKNKTHIPCEKCGSSDAASVDKNGWTHCFSCNANYKGDYAKPMANKDLIDIESEQIIALKKRNLSKETCMKWGTTVGIYKADPVIVFNYKNAMGDIEGQTLRLPNKDFPKFGKTGLYGKWLWKEGGKMLVITEGQLDAMSVSQVNGHKYPVVSIPNGVNSAVNSIKKDLEWVSSFDKVILMFDSDKPGRQAAVEVAELLEPGKSSIVSLPLKDANEMLVAGRGGELPAAIYNATPYCPVDIREPWEIESNRLDEIVVKGPAWPFPALNRMLKGIRKSHIYTLAAREKSGKSTLCKELALNLIKRDIKVGMLFLEESAERAAVSLYAMDKNVPMWQVEDDLSVLGGSGAIKEGLKELTHGRAYIFDHKGRYDPKILRSKLRYLILGCECDLIILDNLSIAIATTTGGEGERKTIDVLVSELVSLINETNATLLNVVHLVKNRKDKDGNDVETVTRADIHGSGAFAKFSDVIIGIEKSGEDKVSLKVLANRDTGIEGYADVLTFNPETGRLI